MRDIFDKGQRRKEGVNEDFYERYNILFLKKKNRFDDKNGHFLISPGTHSIGMFY